MAINYIISLSSAKARRKHIESEFSTQHIKFEFFDALQPSEELDSLVAHYFPNIKESDNLTAGEKACFISHLELWNKCLKSDMPYITIFEDDIILGNDSAYFLNNSDWLTNIKTKSSCFIIRFETFLMPVKSTEDTSLVTINNRKFHFLESVHYGTAGYLISKSAIIYMLDKLQKLEKMLPIDQFMFNQYLTDRHLLIYQLTPALCVQELQFNKQNSKLSSQIEEDRKNLNQLFKPEKQTLWQKLLKEIKRFKQRKQRKLQKSILENGKIVEFK